jgi:hypothetical protein
LRQCLLHNCVHRAFNFKLPLAGRLAQLVFNHSMKRDTQLLLKTGLERFQHLTDQGFPIKQRAVGPKAGANHFCQGRDESGYRFYVLHQSARFNAKS